MCELSYFLLIFANTRDLGSPEEKSAIQFWDASPPRDYIPPTPSQALSLPVPSYSPGWRETHFCSNMNIRGFTIPFKSNIYYKANLIILFVLHLFITIFLYTNQEQV